LPRQGMSERLIVTRDICDTLSRHMPILPKHMARGSSTAAIERACMFQCSDAAPRCLLVNDSSDNIATCCRVGAGELSGQSTVDPTVATAVGEVASGMAHSASTSSWHVTVWKIESNVALSLLVAVPPIRTWLRHWAEMALLTDYALPSTPVHARRCLCKATGSEVPAPAVNDVFLVQRVRIAIQRLAWCADKLGAGHIHACTNCCERPSVLASNAGPIASRAICVCFL